MLCSAVAEGPSRWTGDLVDNPAGTVVVARSDAEAERVIQEDPAPSDVGHPSADLAAGHAAVGEGQGPTGYRRP